MDEVRIEEVVAEGGGEGGPMIHGLRFRVTSEELAQFYRERATFYQEQIEHLAKELQICPAEQVAEFEKALARNTTRRISLLWKADHVWPDGCYDDLERAEIVPLRF